MAKTRRSNVRIQRVKLTPEKLQVAIDRAKANSKHWVKWPSKPKGKGG